MIRQSSSRRNVVHKDQLSVLFWRIFIFTMCWIYGLVKSSNVKKMKVHLWYGTQMILLQRSDTIKTQPDSILIWWISYCYIKLNNKDLAISYIEEYLTYVPDDSTMHFQLEILKKKDGKILNISKWSKKIAWWKRWLIGNRQTTRQVRQPQSRSAHVGHTLAAILPLKNKTNRGAGEIKNNGK